MKQQSITSLPLSPEEERRRRMIKYTIAMSVRVLCIVAMLFVHGWGLVICAAGAILLPYFAVVVANVHSDPRGATVVRPGALEVYRPEGAPYQPSPQPPAAGAQEPTRGEPTAPEPTAPDGEAR